MAKNLLNKYVWLVDTIYRAGKITYEEINRRWQDNDLSEGKELPKKHSTHGELTLRKCLASSLRMRTEASITTISQMQMNCENLAPCAVGSSTPSP